MKKLALLLVLTISSAMADTKFDRTDKLHGITVESGKDGKTRIYRGSFTRTIAFPLEVVRAGIVNFEQKCNQEHSKRREWIEASKKCEFKNDNMVETRREQELLQQKPQHYVLSRHGYNRGEFFYQELISELTRLDPQGREVVEIRQDMLSDSEAKQWVKSPLKNSSVFQKMSGYFTLTKVSAQETEVTYQYHAETTHWLLNKEITVPQVFAGMGNGIRDLWHSIERHSSQSRSLASER